MIQLGILLIVFGFGSLILPEFGFQFRLMEILEDVQPFAGILLGLAGIGLIAFHFVNQKKKSAGPAVGLWNDPSQASAPGVGQAFVQPDGGQAPGQAPGQPPTQAPTHPGFGQSGPTTGGQPMPQFGQPTAPQPGAAPQGYGQPQPGQPAPGQPGQPGQPQPGQPGQPNPYGQAPFGQPQQSPGFGQQNPQ